MSIQPVETTMVMGVLSVLLIMGPIYNLFSNLGAPIAGIGFILYLITILWAIVKIESNFQNAPNQADD
jgi:hypothetical protein